MANNYSLMTLPFIGKGMDSMAWSSSDLITVGHLRRLILVSLLPRLASSQTAVQTSVFFNMFLFINLHKNWHACRYALHLYLCQTASKSDCAKRNERLLKKNARRRLTRFLFYDMRRLIFSLEEANTRNFVEVEGEEANIFVGGG